MSMTKDKKKEIMKLAGLGLIYKINNQYNENGFIISNGSFSQVTKFRDLRSKVCDIGFMSINLTAKEIDENIDRLLRFESEIYFIVLDIQCKLNM